jgi:hypothetical protein
MPPATVILLPSIPIATKRSSSLDIFVSLSFRYSDTCMDNIFSRYTGIPPPVIGTLVLIYVV